MRSLLVEIIDIVVIAAFSALAAWGLYKAFDLTNQQHPWLTLTFASFFYGLRWIRRIEL